MSFREIAFGSDGQNKWSDVSERILKSFGSRRNRTSRGDLGYYRKTRSATQVGEQAISSGDQSVAVGAYAYAAEDGATSVGVYSRAAGRRSTLIGNQSTAGGAGSTHVGEGGNTSGINATTVGQAAFNSGEASTLVGQDSVISGSRTTLVGQGATSDHDDCVLLGVGAQSNDDSQFVIGSSQSPIDAVVLGNGYTNAAPLALVLFRLTQASGANVAAPVFQMAPGLSTGTGLPGEIQVFGSGIGSSGSTAQSEYKRVLINGSRADLTSAVAKQVLSLSMANNTMMGGTIFYTIECSDGADYQSASGVVTFTAVNDSGVTTGGATQDHERSTVTAGSLSSAWAFSAGTIRVTATTAGLGAVTIFRISYSVFNHGSGDVASSHV